MPIKIQGDLPVKEILERENIFVMDEGRAVHQDIRPIQILILNLMPLKEETELQLLRSLSNTPLQVDVTFLAVESHQAKNTSVSHLNTFYQTFPDLRDQKFDGMIVTGAPVEQMEFEEVDYWKELEEISAIDGIGPVIAGSLTKYFAKPENNQKVDHLLGYLHIVKEEKSDNQIFAGMNFVITGSLEHFSNRGEAKNLIESLGGKVTGSVTGKTNYLINNDVTSNSSKNKKARELGIPILSEEDFLKLAEESKQSEI